MIEDPERPGGAGQLRRSGPWRASAILDVQVGWF